jgi:nicotinamidase-related amidase
MIKDIQPVTTATAGLALLVVDPQNDFCGADGVYARHGIDVAPVQRILAPLKELMRACRQDDVPLIASQFTILSDQRGRILLGAALRAARPFLAKEGFRPGTPGHGIVAELPPPDFLIEKPAFSAFFASRLDFVLTRLRITRLLICGVGTNGAVESTLRDAHLRDLDLTLVTDCTAGFDRERHEISLQNMAPLARFVSSQQLFAARGKLP